MEMIDYTLFKNTPQTSYTLAFIFSENLNDLLLINKRNSGVLNGLGGHLEQGESFIECIIREVREESGIKYEDFINFGELEGIGFYISLYAAKTDLIYKYQNRTDETLKIIKTKDLGEYNTKEHLDYLVPLAKKSLLENGKYLNARIRI